MTISLLLSLYLLLRDQASTNFTDIDNFDISPSFFPQFLLHLSSFSSMNTLHSNTF